MTRGKRTVSKTSQLATGNFQRVIRFEGGDSAMQEDAGLRNLISTQDMSQEADNDHSLLETEEAQLVSISVSYFFLYLWCSHECFVTVDCVVTYDILMFFIFIECKITFRSL